MAVTLRFTIEDVTTQLLTYTVIRVYRSDTLGGAYSQITDITLVANTFYYSFEDTTGDINKWYKYSFQNPTGPVESDLSAPFRVEGVTRLRVRQRALSEYDAGMLLVSKSSVLGTFKTEDYRLANTLFRANRGKGTWLHPSAGANQLGKTRMIKSSVVSATSADFTVEPVWTGTAIANADEVEWHWLADVNVWDEALNRALDRYWFVDRVPLKGVANQEEYDLTKIPWLVDKGQVHDVRWYPNRSNNVDDGIDVSWGVNGRWWRIRQDIDTMTLSIKPTVGISVLLYLECTRSMPRIYTDASALPPIAAEELVAALTYDEVLAYLSRPGRGSTDQRQTWRAMRVAHVPELHRLLVKHRPKPRVAPHAFPYPQ